MNGRCGSAAEQERGTTGAWCEGSGSERATAPALWGPHRLRDRQRGPRGHRRTRSGRALQREAACKAREESQAAMDRGMMG